MGHEHHQGSKGVKGLRMDCVGSAEEVVKEWECQGRLVRPNDEFRKELVGQAIEVFAVKLDVAAGLEIWFCD